MLLAGCSARTPLQVLPHAEKVMRSEFESTKSMWRSSLKTYLSKTFFMTPPCNSSQGTWTFGSRQISPLLFRNTMIVLMMYTIDEKTSFRQSTSWHRETLSFRFNRHERYAWIELHAIAMLFSGSLAPYGVLKTGTIQRNVNAPSHHSLVCGKSFGFSQRYFPSITSGSKPREIQSAPGKKNDDNRHGVLRLFLSQNVTWSDGATHEQ